MVRVGIVQVILHVIGIMGLVRPITCLLGVLLIPFLCVGNFWGRFLTILHCA